MWVEAVAERYGEALFELATEKRVTAEVERDLHTAAALLANQPALAHALEAPSVPDAVKRNIVQRILGTTLSPMVLNFLYVLVDRRRIDALGDIAADFKRRSDEAQGRVDVEVHVAAELSPEVRQQVEVRLSEITGRKAALKWHVNPEILGGIVVRIKDSLIDYSLRSQLQELKERLVRVHA